MKTVLMGDIHGCFNDYQFFLKDVERSIQLGDFGIGMGPEQYWHDKVNAYHAHGNHRFIRGNHDNPHKCKDEMVGYIPDGTIENDVMFVGGAWSIDKDYRNPGIDWWRDEECSNDEFEEFLSLYEINKPRVMITHDGPTLASYYMFLSSGRSTYAGNVMYLTKTAEYLQRMFEIHQPEEWYFGHWHHSVQMNINGTKFTCLGILDTLEVEL